MPAATLLLTRLRSETHTLLADDNQLHDLGVYALIAGLARRRDRPVTSSWEDWEGLRRISLGGNDIGDKGTIALLRDASRQGGELETLMSLGLQHNRIKLRERTAEEIVGYLNASRLIELNFASNPLNPRGIVKFFEGLTAPIQAIDLCDCDLTEAVLGEDGVIAIVQAVERRNFTITTLDLEGNASVEDMGGEFEYLDLWNDTDLGGGALAPQGH
ncbi:hypothetical protein Q8F55_005840 [Vanrija albida]|uniref:Uncharacterized protein n=1 Tax=Vanrija albida TaxID=181172 RepID=A0ABR3Q2R5_9TREE